MLTQQNNKYANICSMMRAQIAKGEERIRISKENMQKKLDTEYNKDYYLKVIDGIQRTTDFLKPILNATKTYLAEKQAGSSRALNAAIRTAASVVPDGDANVIFKYENEEAWLETTNGEFVEVVQGSGFRGVTSALLRAVLLRLQPQYLSTIYFDEPFAKLSIENSANLAKYLPILAQSTQIILVEQKREICESSDCLTYSFFLNDNGESVVKKETSL